MKHDHRYEVTSVWGVMEGQLAVGAIIRDRFKGRGEQPWQIERGGEIVGGWTARYLGRADENAGSKA